MSRQKLRIKNTPLENLISNLRGEIGEIITSWVLLRHMMAKVRELTTDDVSKDIANESLTFVSMLRTKLSDEIVARLSEVAEEKIGQLTFFFAAEKLGKLHADAKAFKTFIIREKFQEKRNQDISHKQLPEEWAKHAPIAISYRTQLRGIAHALRLMKKIDRIVLGPSAKYFWPEMRKKRYELMKPASVVYMLAPFMNLSPDLRERVILEEMADGRAVWCDMPATINGLQVTVSACREWGAFMLGDRMIVLPHYPLQSVEVQIPEAVPITEERIINAKYRVIKMDGDSLIYFAPVHRAHQLDTDAVTELVDFHIILRGQNKQEFGQLNVGDEKEFSMKVTVLTGFSVPGATLSPSDGNDAVPQIGG